jgi:hypothetical protein
MPKVKYDVSQFADAQSDAHAPVGTYILTVEDIDGPKPSSNGNAMLEVRFRPTHNAQGERLKEEYAPIWHYPLLEHDSPFVQARTKEFFTALGLPLKGSFDTDKVEGMKVLGRLKSDTDQDGDYRPRIAKLMKVEQADEAEPEEAEEAEADEEEDEDAVDLDSLDRSGLKKFIKDEELDVTVKKSMSDDDIRTAIVEAMPEDEEEDEDEEDDDEEEGEDEEQDEEGGDNYDDLSVAELKAELKERELPTNGARAVLVQRLRKDDSGEPF